MDIKEKALLPHDCQTMAQVRSGVDALDSEIVRLLTIRQSYMNAAARIKPNREMVRDEERIEAVVANVKAKATESGLSHEIVEPVYRLLIEKCIEHELAVFDELKSE